MANEQEHKNSADDSDSDSDVAFATMDFAGVDFGADTRPEGKQDDANRDTEPTDDKVLAASWDRAFVFGDFSGLDDDDDDANKDALPRLRDLGKHLASGKYADALRGKVAHEFFHGLSEEATTVSSIRRQVIAKGESVAACLEMELLAVAALNLFLQSNYTGPIVEDDDTTTLANINPHSCFASLLGSAEESMVTDAQEEKMESVTTRRSNEYQNAVLSELAVAGEWPCQVCKLPYFLLVARSILSTLADPARASWTNLDCANEGTGDLVTPPESFLNYASKLSAAPLWSARAVVAHERLLQAQEPSVQLWDEVNVAFRKASVSFCSNVEASKPNPEAATVMLEQGLAEHYFDRPKKGKKCFATAQEYSGLTVEVTGAEGKRTKFQQEATAQMLVRARSAVVVDNETREDADLVKQQMIEHAEDEILLERVKFTDEKENAISILTVLDQTILLALCLDVKNSNPADGLTSEEIGAFLARVLDNHDDWMVYSTGLLERSWLEFERNHARERALLQMQALADQHSNRLTITQSTRQSVEDSAPVQERLKNIHNIVYPPRWSILADLATRYAGIGIVTSAAELYTEIEFWDEVVECYRRAGKVALAKQIVEERLAINETPRMWAALGDLTDDPTHYERSAELSKGRFSTAYVALGKHYFDKGEMEKSAEYYEKSLRNRPLAPYVWFRLGTISMRLGRWDRALQAFSEVVQQEPEEADAWANVAAVHLHNKHPAEAFPALNESLKYRRNNWRVWVSKLHTCLDLKKYDEAVQACNTILDQTYEKKSFTGGPAIDEDCIRAIVGGALEEFHASRGDAAALDSSRRSLSRVSELLERISTTSHIKPWVFETIAFFEQQVGNEEKMLESLLKEYRLLQTDESWEKEDAQLSKVCDVVSSIAQVHLREGSRDSLNKAKFLVRGVVKKVRLVRDTDASIPDEFLQTERLLGEIEDKIKSL